MFDNISIGFPVRPKNIINDTNCVIDTLSICKILKKKKTSNEYHIFLVRRNLKCST